MARDLFILSYYLRGIPFIDLAYLRKTDIQDNVLCYRRSKTGRMLTITLEPWMWEIIKRYKCENTDSPYLLKIIRRPGSIPEERKQYESALRLYNKHLYRLSERLGLRVRLTSYLAKHNTFAIKLKIKQFPYYFHLIGNYLETSEIQRLVSSCIHSKDAFVMQI